MTILIRRRLGATGVAIALVATQLALLASASPRATSPPPTPVPPRGSLSPFPSVLHTPSDATALPHLSARGAILADLSDGKVLYRKAADAPVPIASLTKVMTALLALEREDLSHVVQVDPRAVYRKGDYGASSTLGLRAGERITVEDLLYAMLLGSANDAADALAFDMAGSLEAFVELMNERARQLGMRDTRFFSSDGLDDRGRSTPADLLRLVRVTNADPRFVRISSARFRTIAAPEGPPRRIQNRNALLWLYPWAFGTKTGSTAGAGACLIASARRDGRDLVAIVLHADPEAFSDAATLLQYGFEGFHRATLVQQGDPKGDVRIRGGVVPVIAGTTATTLVPTSQQVRERIVVDPGAAFPPAPGERVATLKITAPGLTLATVPLVVSSVPPPPADVGPWWARTIGAVARGLAGAVRAVAG